MLIIIYTHVFIYILFHRKLINVVYLAHIYNMLQNRLPKSIGGSHQKNEC